MAGFQTFIPAYGIVLTILCPVGNTTGFFFTSDAFDLERMAREAPQVADSVGMASRSPEGRRNTTLPHGQASNRWPMTNATNYGATAARARFSLGCDTYTVQ